MPLYSVIKSIRYPQTNGTVAVPAILHIFCRPKSAPCFFEMERLHASSIETDESNRKTAKIMMMNETGNMYPESGSVL